MAAGRCSLHHQTQFLTKTIGAVAEVKCAGTMTSNHGMNSVGDHQNPAPADGTHHLLKQSERILNVLSLSVQTKAS